MHSSEGRVDEIHQPKRAEDFSVVARIASFAMKWQWVIWVIVSTVIAIGFDFKTPSQKFQEVQAEIQKNRDETKAVQERVGEIYTILNGLAIDACDRLKGNRYARSQLQCDRRQIP